MIPWELIECAQVPGDNGEICLYRRGGEFSIRVNGHELMNSRAHGSEEALAGLDASFAALRPEGVLAVWSAAPDSVTRKHGIGYS